MREILRIPGISVSRPLVSLLLIWYQVVIVLHSLQLCIHHSICVDHRAARCCLTAFAWVPFDLFQYSTSATYTRFKHCAMLRQTYGNGQNRTSACISLQTSCDLHNNLELLAWQPCFYLKKKRERKGTGSRLPSTVFKTMV